MGYRVVGCSVGYRVVGCSVGYRVGLGLGAVGSSVGNCVGAPEGVRVGWVDGDEGARVVGCRDGLRVGVLVGSLLGRAVGGVDIVGDTEAGLGWVVGFTSTISSKNIPPS